MGHRNNIKEIRERTVRALKNEEYELWDAKRNLGYIELEKPLRHGWFTYLTLREDISRREDAAIFQEIIDKCTLNIWGSDKKHADKVWNARNRKNNKIQWPGFKKLNHFQYSQLSPSAKKYFEPFSKKSKYRGKYKCNVPRYFFVKTYCRAYITKRKVTSNEIDQRIGEIEAILNHNIYFDYKESFYRSRRSNRDWKAIYHRSKRKKKNQSLQKYLTEEILDEDLYLKQRKTYW